MVIYAWKLLPPVHKKHTCNSEAKRTDFDLSLFADDTTIIGNGQEIDIGKELIEEVMETLKSKLTNKGRACYLWGLRNWQYKNVRNLVRQGKDTKMRLQRAGKVWSTIRKRFIKCMLSKTTQAKVFEAVC